jgi:hypothetical protein
MRGRGHVRIVLSDGGLSMTNGGFASERRNEPTDVRVHGREVLRTRRMQNDAKVKSESGPFAVPFDAKSTKRRGGTKKCKSMHPRYRAIRGSNCLLRYGSRRSRGSERDVECGNAKRSHLPLWHAATRPRTPGSERTHDTPDRTKRRRQKASAQNEATFDGRKCAKMREFARFTRSAKRSQSLEDDVIEKIGSHLPRRWLPNQRSSFFVDD